MATLVDTNVLIDVAFRDPEWRDWSRGRMAEALKMGALVINPVIFSEFSYRYESSEEVDALLDPSEFQREHLPWDSAFAAGRAFRIYRSNGGRRERTLPDFLIGAHAVIRGYRLLTRDPAGYRRYFPMLDIIAPDTHP
ncbi:type II toxin-antitoxin system VapC family toxin [Hoeflea sp.]|uniref:type II toxin-antitoxin system VapC family toxin n=1 Tax=Hoeflea sp. TaxID=1940281 RepID=UPI0019A6BB97|nr:type II toxin-antitoxin system VapC family toxin [Hoeflea sp.]MBC7281795.1 type II toxin-antitoxin system VapC family toxin [Hoeflea sp.]